MKAPDPYVLEYLAEEGPTSPKALSDELPFSRGYLNTRCQDLADHGMVMNIGNGMYQIKERGKEWLNGDFDASALDEGNPATVTA